MTDKQKFYGAETFRDWCGNVADALCQWELLPKKYDNDRYVQSKSPDVGTILVL